MNKSQALKILSGREKMKTKNKISVSRKTLFGIILIVAVLCLSFWVGFSPSVQAKVNNYFITHTVTVKNGVKLTQMIINGPPTPPPGMELERKSVKLPKSNPATGVVTLPVPAYDWYFGCSATSGSMIAAYYDRNGYPNMYTGSTNGGVMPMTNSVWGTWVDSNGDTYGQNPLDASRNGLDGRTTRGSINDYWVYYMSGLQDPFMTNGWTEHTWGTAIGDYMKTSQYNYGNDDGSTSFYGWGSYYSTPLTCSDMEGYGVSANDGTYGRKLFYQARGYTVTDCYAQSTDNIISGGFSFAQYKAEIDAGRPVMLNLAGHTIVGVGYNSSSNTVYLNDTWDQIGGETMTWGTSYYGMQLESVSIVNLLPATHTISGSAGVAGATLSYTDGSPKTATADGSGNYTFTVSNGWTGTVTPSMTGYTFSPTYLSYTNVTADQPNQNYTATPITYTISGSAGVAGASLSYTDGSPKTATADGSGNYNFTVSYSWSGTVTPSLSHYVFSPVSKSYTNVLSDQPNQNYTATPGFNISGTTGVAGTTLTYTGGSTVADGSGNYSFTIVTGWSGTVTPSVTGYTFSPPSTSYTNVTADQLNQNYTPIIMTFNISGNAGVAGATLDYTGGSTVADGSGNYSFPVDYNWSGTVTPSLVGYSFLPASMSYTNVAADQPGQNYTATLVNFAITGNVGMSGVTLSYTVGSVHESVVSDKRGNYSLYVPYGWSGQVVPAVQCGAHNSTRRCSFVPAAHNYTNVTANLSNQNFILKVIQ